MRTTSNLYRSLGFTSLDCTQSPIYVSRELSGVSSFLSSLCISNSSHPSKFPRSHQVYAGSSNISQKLMKYPVQSTAAMLSLTSASRVAPQDTSSFLPVYMFWLLLERQNPQTRGGTECRPVPSQHSTATRAKHTRDWKNITEYPVLPQHSTRYLKNKGVLNF